jgi:ribosomal protein S18 acetylase RimI-like enzyme
VSETVVTIEPGPARDPWIPLLELADEREPIRRYLNEGALYGIVDDTNGAPVAAVLVIDLDDHTAELRAVAVAEHAQGGGIGTRIVKDVCDRLRATGRRIVVGTASSGTRQLAFYQRLGFRVRRVERDFFNAARGYPEGLAENGIPTRDMVWMDLDD